MENRGWNCVISLEKFSFRRSRFSNGFNIDLAERDLGERRRDRKFEPLGAICNAAFVASVYIYLSSFLREEEEGGIDEESGFRFRAREDYSSRAEIESIFNDPFQLSRLEKMKRREGEGMDF